MMWPDCSPPDVAAALAHFLENIAIADFRPNELEARFAKLPLEAEVGHDRGDHGIALQLSPRAQSKRDQRHQLVAVDDLALLVDHDQPIGVAVESDPDVGAAGDNRFLEKLGMRRTAFVVNVEAVR
jgi:hypothetical protein